MKKILLIFMLILSFSLVACKTTTTNVKSTNSSLNTTSSMTKKSETTKENTTLTSSLEEIIRNNEIYDGRDLSEILGITHVSGRYYLTKKDFLNEGVDQIEALGVKTVKLWLSRTPGDSYFFNSKWPTAGKTNIAIDSKYPDNWNLLDEYKDKNFYSLIDMLKISYFQDALSKDRSFTTYVFETMEFITPNWKNGFTTEEVEAVKKELRDFTVYLMTSQKGTGRTFLLQNWEGDNALNMDEITDYNAGTTAIEGMIAWMNARQDGINEGKNYVLSMDPENDVKVYGVLEMNQVNDYNSSVEQFKYRTVVDYVVPYTHMDLYSLSTWGSRLPGEEKSLLGKLDHIADKAPDSEAFGDKNVMLGEFGAYQSTYEKASNNYSQYLGDSAAGQYMANRKQIEYALEWGIQYVLYWELYCNGYKNNIDCRKAELGCHVIDDSGQLVADYESLEGVWLIDSNGDYTPTYYYFRNLFKKEYISDELKDASNVYGYSSGLTFVKSYSYTTLDDSFVINKGSKTESLIYKVNGRIMEASAKVFYSKEIKNRIRFYVSKNNVDYIEVKTKFVASPYDEYGVLSGYIMLDEEILEDYVYLKIEIDGKTSDDFQVGGVVASGVSFEFQDDISGFKTLELNGSKTITLDKQESKILSYRFDRVKNLTLGLYVKTNDISSFDVNNYLTIASVNDTKVEELLINISSIKIKNDLYYVTVKMTELPEKFSEYIEIEVNESCFEKVYLDYLILSNEFIRKIELTGISQNDCFEEVEIALNWYKPKSIDKKFGIGSTITNFDITKKIDFLLNDPYVTYSSKEISNGIMYTCDYGTYKKTFKFTSK